MANYEPDSRRRILDAFRKTARPAVRFCNLLNIHPDFISYMSIVVSALAGACFMMARRNSFLLLMGPVFCYVRLWFNMLDGMVAISSGKASRQGEIVNELPDRISDVLVFAGIAHSGYCLLPVGYWAGIFAVLTAYVGVLSQAVAGYREFSGIMSKPWRMVVVHIGAWALYGQLTWYGDATLLPPLTILDMALFVVIAGCIQTIGIRLYRAVQRIKKEDQQ